MSPDNLSWATPYFDQQRSQKQPISLSDIDVIESLVVWLSTPHAGAFVDACMTEYKAVRALERSKNNIALA